MPGTFLYPYAALLQGAAWNIQQNLEGLRLASSNVVQRDAQGNMVGSYWSPGEATIPLLGALGLFSIMLAVLFFVCGYVLGRRRGALAAAGLLLPGCLNMLSLWPKIAFLPARFSIDGTGVLGSPLGILPLLALGVVLGWCATIILADLLCLGDRFGHLYDHLWCAAALVAAVFFVADAGAGKHAKDQAESQANARQASAYLARQAAAYAAWCDKHQQAGLASCQWASEVQQKLLEYSVQPVEIFAQFGPDSAADLYARFGDRTAAPDELMTIRREIAAYNAALCPVRQLGPGVSQGARPSSVCMSTPAVFCTAFPDPVDGKAEPSQLLHTCALASECIIPTLVQLKQRQTRLLAASGDNDRARHDRWLYYVFFSLVVGGKIATSTMKFFSMGQRSEAQARRVVHLVRRAAAIIGAGWRLGRRGAARIGSASSLFAAKAWAAVTRPRAKARVVSRPRSPRPVRRRV